MEIILNIFTSLVLGLGVGMLINVSWDRLTRGGKILAGLTVVSAIVTAVNAASGL